MKMCQYPLERRSPLYLWYSTPVQNPATIVLILYFPTATHGQVRFDVSTGSVVSKCCWYSQTSPLDLMLHKCMAILVFSLWLKSQPRDLVSGHQNFFFHQMTSIHLVRAHTDSPSVTAYLLCRLPSPNPESRYMINIASPFVDNSLFVGFNLFKNL
jgi:hypothetical protein